MTIKISFYEFKIETDKNSRHCYSLSCAVKHFWLSIIIQENSQLIIDFSKLIQPVPKTAVFFENGYYVWGGSVVKGDDEYYHMFYSRWKTEFGFNAWVTHSEIKWDDGSIEKVARLERPQVLCEEGGSVMLYCACSKGDPFCSITFNVHIPLRKTDIK